MDLDIRQRELPYKPMPMWLHCVSAFLLCGFVYWAVAVLAIDVIWGPYTAGTAEAKAIVTTVLRTAPIFGGLAIPIWCLIVRRHRRNVIAGLPDDRYFSGKPEDYWEWANSDAADAWGESETYSYWGDWDEYDEYAQ